MLQLSSYIYTILWQFSCIYFLEILGHNLKATLTAATNWQVAAGSHCQHKLQLRCSQAHHGLKAAVRRNNNETAATTVVCIKWDGLLFLKLQNRLLIKQMFHTPACCICLVALPPLILMIWAAASQQINVSCVLAGCKKETDQPTKTLSLKLLVTFGKCWSSPFCFLFCFQKPWKKNNHQKPLSKHHVVWTAPF